MAERLKAHAWKACLGKPNVGSNPTLSAKEDLGFTNYDFRFKNPKSKIINRKFDGERWPSG